MKKFLMPLAVCVALMASACQSSGTNEAAYSNAASSNSTAKTTAAPDPNAPVTFPFPEFASVETTAKAGEFVLSPAIEGIRNGMEKGVASTYTFNRQKMVAPDEEKSEVDFSNSKVKVPNAYLIPLPAGQKAKKGDIVLTWMTPFSSMCRAIVVDAANPSEPTVRYLDIDYDIAVKGSDGKTGVGQSDEKLKPDSFVKISNPFDAGMAIAYKVGEYMNSATVLRVNGDKVLVKNWIGSLVVVDKKDCVPVPLAPGVKAGDRVKAERSGRYADATVARVDAKIGRVFVKFDGQTDEKAIAFGNVMKG
jgi:hypothetical protein